ncbi:MAG: hypothetical protein IPK81_22955 [Rhodospirillales bacterium]|nr:MAG: hypothetical protein IPK81_22955 [Rhodospirillales bacterium]
MPASAFLRSSFAALLMAAAGTAAAQAPPAKPAAPPSESAVPAPVVCAPKQLFPMSDEIRKRVVGWLRQEGLSGRHLIDFSCRIDDRRMLLGLVDATALDSRVYALDLTKDNVSARLVLEGLIEAPVLVGRPGGGRSLFHVASAPDRGVTLRSYRATDLASGKTQTLYAAPFDANGRGCAFAGPKGVQRLLTAAAAKMVEAKGGGAAIAIDHEEVDCASGRRDRRTDVFVPTRDGFVAQK